MKSTCQTSTKRDRFGLTAFERTSLVAFLKTETEGFDLRQTFPEPRVFKTNGIELSFPHPLSMTLLHKRIAKEFLPGLVPTKRELSMMAKYGSTSQQAGTVPPVDSPSTRHALDRESPNVSVKRLALDENLCRQWEIQAANGVYNESDTRWLEMQLGLAKQERENIRAEQERKLRARLAERLGKSPLLPNLILSLADALMGYGNGAEYRNRENGGTYLWLTDQKRMSVLRLFSAMRDEEKKMKEEETNEEFRKLVRKKARRRR